MHEYDTVLKALLQGPQATIVEKIIGARIDHWVNVEFPEVLQTRVDLLGVTVHDHDLAAVELQSANDIKLPLRMAEYALRIYRRYESFPRQYVLYVGNEPLRMPSELAGPNFLCRYNVIDIRTLDEESLLNGPFNSDNIMAILASHRDRRETIRRILARIATLEGERRDAPFKKLIILAGLRKLGEAVRAKIKHMPILDDIMDHDVLGPTFREGLQKGLEQGVQQGAQQGELAIIRRLIHKRFGGMPTWVEESLANLSTVELEDLSVRLFDVQNIEELFLPDAVRVA
jgi:predicted transposase YdaD